MNRSLWSVALTAAAFAGVLQAQGGSGASSLPADFKQAYESVKNNLMKSAEKVPDSDWGAKPLPDVRSFAEVFAHVATAQMRTCSAILGEQKSPAADAKSKSEVMAALKDAFAECDKAYDSLTDANAGEPVKIGRGQRSRAAALAGNTSHDNEQYGILTVYMRLKGILPPSSEKPASR
jgi:uncharacterized damage-inducible protein DinB